MGEHMLALGRMLRQADSFRVTFACSNSPGGKPFLKRAAQIGMEAVPVSSAAELSCLLKNRLVDIFHIHAGIGWEGHDGIFCAEEHGIRAIVRTEHLPYLLTDPCQQRDYIELVKHIDRIICVSNDARESFVRAGVPREKVRTVLNGIITPSDLPDREMCRADVRRELGLPSDALLCLTVGRMTEQKGHKYLLDAIPGTASQVEHPHFLFVGSGPLEHSLKAQAAAHGLYGTDGTDTVHFLQRRSDVPRLIAASDLFVLPSLFEGLPLVALEAMAGGLPVVGTRVSGTSEAIEDLVSGVLVSPGSVEELSSALVDLLANPGKARRLGRNALRLQRDRFTAEKMARETAAIYREAMQEAWRPAISGVETPFLQI